MTWTTRFTCMAASLLLATAGIAQAQGIKKYVTPDGKTIYSDVPVPGAREVGTVAAPPAVDPEERRQAEKDARSAERRSNEAEQNLQEEQDQQDRIEAARQQLENARQTLANSKEPLPGERKGTAGGASRLTDAYYRRQAANEQAVVEAQRRLDTLLAEQ